MACRDVGAGMDLFDTLRDQDGLVLRAQALECGLSAATVDRHLARREWIVVHPCVYRPADRPMSPLMRVRGAAMWAGRSAVLIGTSALAWWRVVDEVPATIELAVGEKGGHTAPSGIRLVRRDVPRERCALVEGQWTLHRAHAVLEAAAASAPLEGARLVDRALQEGTVTVDGLRDALAAFGQRHGVVAARRLVQLAAGGARSEGERRLARALRSGGLSGWAPNLRVTLGDGSRVELDLAFPAARLVIEVDGWAYHRDVDRFRRDARRQNALVAEGWRVLRVTWYDLVEDPARVAALVAGTLAAAA